MSDLRICLLIVTAVFCLGNSPGLIAILAGKKNNNAKGAAVICVIAGLLFLFAYFYK